MSKLYRKVTTLFDRFMNFVRSDWQWTGAKIKGYGVIRDNRKNIQAHRLSYEFFIGPIPEGQLVLHSCDDPSCVNPDCLHLGTDAINARERKERGRNGNRSGEKNGLSKLTTAEVKEIKVLLSKGFSHSEIARKYNVTPSNITSIANNKTWKHIT